MEHHGEPKFRADPDRVFVFKVLLPAIVLGGLLPLILTGARLDVHLFYRFLVTAPFLLWGVFGLTAAQIRPDARALRYRRLFKWREIPYDQIVDCKTSWAPAMGRIRLRRPIPPWRRLYFVLEGPLFEGTFPGGQTELTRAVNAQVAKSRGEAPADDRKSDENLVRNIALVLFFGFALAIALRTVFPQQAAPMAGGLPVWMSAYERVARASARWPWGLVTCAVLAAGVRWRGLKGRSWILVLGIGATLGLMLASAVSRS